MTLSVRGDIYTQPTNTTFKAACASGSIFVIATNEPRLRKYNITLTTMNQTASTGSLVGSVPTDLMFISGPTAVLSYSGTARVDLLDVNSFATTGITTNVTAVNRSAPQQLAGLPSQGLALATSGTAGRLTLISLTCAAAVNPTFLSGQLATCVIPRPDSNTFLIGTNNGKIHEMNTAAVLISTVHLPSAPFVTAPSIVVQALSYYNNYVLAATDAGMLVNYNWSTKNVNSSSVNMLGANNFTVLSNSCSGVVLMSNSGAELATFKGIMELYSDNVSVPNIDSQTFLEANIGVANMGIEPTGQYAWVLSTSNNFITGRIYQITSPAKVGVTTEVQNPIGNDVAARIIRLRDPNDIGGMVVETDQALFPGVATITVTNNRNYVELCLYGNIVNGNPPYIAWDIREMQS